MFFSSFLKDFKDFINKGNVVELAVGLILGDSFTQIVNTVVKNVFTPLISLTGEHNLQLHNRFLFLKKPGNCTKLSLNACYQLYPTPLDAENDNGIVLNYGVLIQSISNFLLVSLVLFSIVKLATKLKFNDDETNKKDCLFCFNSIDIRAKKCGFCNEYVEKVAIDVKIEDDTLKKMKNEVEDILKGDKVKVNE
ncbi:hypothetical protein HK099_005393 [Clydaea vesicula]|uniref:Large-conductance mechanosensitive channel n=1 Tax=Clydaea vesicula TaxID=447962 RepID=A0AAD5XXM5_9FUNG|nr:hypothetical protein HK099_005393 [Clydaea vesicula]KAJ3389150.1 hypothetical protein HDU92_001146 [Lobulomyces angularis]